MKVKAVFSTFLVLMLVGFTVKQKQAMAGEPKRDSSKTDVRIFNRPPSRVNTLIYVDYKHRNNKQNFVLFTKERDKSFKHIQFIKIAAIGNFHELRSLYEEKKPRVNFRNKKGETALVKVLDGPYDEDTIRKLQYLISVGVRLNVRGKSSKSEYTSPLGVAIWNSRAVFHSGNAAEVQIAQQVLELLITAGADVSGLEANGKSLLHMAVETNNLFAAKLLLESGAEVIPIDDTHKTPLDIAESGEMIQLLKKYQAKGLS